MTVVEEPTPFAERVDGQVRLEIETGAFEAYVRWGGDVEASGNCFGFFWQESKVKV